MENKISDDVLNAESALMDKNYRDYFSDERSRTFDEIAEYNFNKEEFEKNYGVPYIDFAKRNIDEDYGGHTIRGVAKAKDVAYSVAGYLVDLYQQIGEIGFNVGTGVAGLQEKGEWTQLSDEEKKDTWINPEKAYEPQTKAGEFAGTVVKSAAAVAPVSTLLKATKGVKAVSSLAKTFSKTKIGEKFLTKFEPYLTEMLAGGLAFYKDKENVMNFIEENSDDGLVKSFAGLFSIDEDDNAAEVAFKQAADAALSKAIIDPIVAVGKYIKSGIKSKRIVDDAITTLDDVVKEGNAKTGVVNTDAVDEITGELFGDGYIPREKVAISYADEAKIVRDKLIQEGVDPSTLSTEQVKEMVKANPSVWERTVVAEDNLNKTVAQARNVTKSLQDSLDAGDITSEEFISASARALTDSMNAFNVTIDAVSEGASAGGFLSKSESYKGVKKFIDTLKTHPDKILTEKFFRMLADTSDDKQFLSALSVLNKKGKKIKDGVAFANNVLRNLANIQQNILLDSPDVGGKNVLATISMLSIDSFDKIPASAVGYVRNAARHIMGMEKDYDVHRIQEVAYNLQSMRDVAKDSFYDFLDRLSGRKSKPGVLEKFKSNIHGESAYLQKQTGYDDEGLWAITKTMNKYSMKTVNDTIDNFAGLSMQRSRIKADADSYVARMKDAKNLTDEQAELLRKQRIEEIMDLNPKTKVDISEIKELNAEAVDILAKQKSFDDSLEHAKEMTLRGGQGTFTKTLTKVLNAFPLSRFWAPFVSTISTFAVDRMAADRTIVGALSPRVWKNFMKGGKERDAIIGRQIVGNTLLWNLAEMPQDVITGDWSSDPKIRNLQKARGFQPYSVKFGDKYYSFKEWALAPILASGVDIRDAIESGKVRGDDEDLLNYIRFTGQSIGSYLINETAAATVRDFFDAVENQNPLMLEKMSDSVENVIASFVPRVGSFYSQADDAGYTTAQVRDSLWQKVKVKLGKDTEPELDFLGNPLIGSEVNWGLATKKINKGELIDRLWDLKAGFNPPKRTESYNGFDIEFSKDNIRTILKEMKNIGVEDLLISKLDSDSFANIDNLSTYTDEGKRKLKIEELNEVYNDVKHRAIKNLIDNDPEFDTLYKEAIFRTNERKGRTPDYTESLVNRLVPTFR
jgi:hypothetical protein